MPASEFAFMRPLVIFASSFFVLSVAYLSSYSCLPIITRLKRRIELRLAAIAPDCQFHTLSNSVVIECRGQRCSAFDFLSIHGNDHIAWNDRILRSDANAA